MTATRQDRLRAMADWLDQYGEAFTDAGLYIGTSEARYDGGGIQIMADAATFAAGVRLLGGHREKSGDGQFFEVERDFGLFTVKVFAYRNEVCERVVTGQRTVEREITKVVGTETVTEDVIEWKCRPLLAEVES